MRHRILLGICLCFGFIFLLPSPLLAQEIRLLGWNVESGSPSEEDPAEGIAPGVIADQLEAIGAYDIVGLTEVNEDHAQLFATALGGEPILSDTGGGDRTVIVYDNDVVEQLDVLNLHEYDGIVLNPLDSQGRFRVRSPLIAKFRVITTGVEFLFVLNHLARGDNDLREDQARALCAWAEDQTLPIVAMGDYNFDYETADDEGNESFDIFMNCNMWEWVEPVPLVDTNWADVRNLLPERVDQFPDSILDFAFLAGPAREWNATSTVIVRANDFPDTGETSDHRPVELIINSELQPPVAEPEPQPEAELTTVEEILQLIEDIRDVLARLEQLIRGLEP